MNVIPTRSPLLAACLVLLGCGPTPAPSDPAPDRAPAPARSVAAPAGHLLIVGGGPRPDEVMDHFIRLAGGPDRARIAVIPTASGNPARAAESLAAEMRDRGAAETVVVHAESPAEADDALAGRLDGVSGVWFSGGVQSRVTAALKDTPVEAKLHALYRDGAVLGGTSAGAAIMSPLMITGDERRPGGDRPRDEPWITVDRDNVVTEPGFGFLDAAIVDQHFLRRKRHNRLLSLVLEHPTAVGVGIDESTAIHVRPDGTWAVLGESVAVVYDARDAAVSPAAAGALGAAGVRLHVLPSGSVFDHRTGAAELAPPTVEDLDYDLLITGGTVLDGTGSPGVVADVAVRGDRIVRIGPGLRAGGAEVIDATGLHVAPGFVDVHTHLDPILRLPDAESHVRQGVTTALGGPDGGSPWPMGAHLDSLASLGVGLNVAYTVGHNTVRRAVMGLDDRPATAEELDRMRAMVARAMGEGAWGLSTGLKYLPGAFADLDEVVALASVAADSGGFYTSHMRDEGLELMASVDETIAIGRRAGLPVVLSHHKVVGKPMWGRSAETLERVDRARAEGVDVRIDQYPYTATHTGISILVPEWSRAGGQEAFLERLADPALRDSIVRGVVRNIRLDRGGDDLRRVQFSGVEWDPSLEGRTLHDWALREGTESTPEVGAELVIEAVRRGGARAIFHALDEQDVRRIMRHPQTMIASDGRLVRPGEGHPHPRWYGTFPRVLGHYVREEGVLDWPEAIHKMTGLPASLLRLDGRGTLVEGAYADLVVYDPERVEDRSTFQEPHAYPAGIDWVVVNGAIAVRDGEFQDVRQGRVLRRTDAGAAPSAPGTDW